MTDVLIRPDRPGAGPSRSTGDLTELPCQADGAADLYSAESPAELEIAKELCGPCPLRSACLEGALARREPWGVWGGAIVVAGEVIAAKRPRGRPRKQQAA